jgi:hypothetical protein
MAEQGGWTSKADLLARITQEHMALDHLLGTLTVGQLLQRGVYGDLAVKDVLAHLAAWERMEAGWLDASRRGAPVVRFTPEYVVTDANYETMIEALNAQVFADNEVRSPADILADLQAAQAAVLAAVTALSEDELNDPHAFPWWDGEPIWTSIAGNTYEHYQEHRELIQAWLDRR